MDIWETWSCGKQLPMSATAFLAQIWLTARLMCEHPQWARLSTPRSRRPDMG